MKKLLIAVTILKWMVMIPMLGFTVAVTLYAFKEVGWDAPYRWVCLSFLVLMITEYFLQAKVNNQQKD